MTLTLTLSSSPFIITRQVNDVVFKDRSNDQAIKAIREAASKPGPINLLIIKHYWLRLQDAVRKRSTQNADEQPLNLAGRPYLPLDPIVWVEHTKQVNRIDKGSGY